MFYAMWLEGQLLWNMPLLACLICLVAIYVYVVVIYTNIKLYQKQPLLYFLSLVIMYVTFGSPFETISHLSFSLHMLQMSILYFIISPLFVLGIPYPLIETIRKQSLSKQVNKFVLPSKVALFAFGALFLIYHFPIVLTFLSQTAFVHNGYLFVLLVLSFRMWQPITVPDPKNDHTQEQKKRYLFLSGLVIMPACLLFIVTALIGGMNNPLLSQLTANLCISPSQLSQLSSLDLLPSPFNTRLDQMFAGILMLGMHKFGLILTVRLEKNLKSGAVAGVVD
ncbi:cytochrome c oxidase assembly protein [Bacillus sp. sid0103]|uniref:cytochrome c oxidase assembly protein n=1 Tax=Bacillus sp. sid0103 TaxID=2856337 RepID=UPI001C473E6C|nr:cytochrome c oxidase assembly protein [Bacillus sp. sid0103]MBV7505772.1 cytochrome c oxidase assembly protein [Bacillus sp. sid0103]